VETFLCVGQMICLAESEKWGEGKESMERVDGEAVEFMKYEGTTYSDSSSSIIIALSV